MKLPELLISANRAIAAGELAQAADYLEQALQQGEQAPQVQRAYVQVQANLSARLLKAGTLREHGAVLNRL